MIIQALIKLKIQPNMSGEEKKRQWIYEFLKAETKPSFFIYRIQSKKKKKEFIIERNLLKEKGEDNN